MTRDEFMEHAEREICMAFEGRRNRLKNLVEQAWAEGKRNAEIDGIRDLIHGALGKQKTATWVSMDEAKPDHDGMYLTFHGLSIFKDWIESESLVMIGVCPWYKDKGGWYSNLADQPIKTVTHWMELPTAPEGWGCDEAD